MRSFASAKSANAIATQPEGLETLLQRRVDIWRGKGRLLHDAAPSVIASGYPALDAQLDGGWPQGALTELLLERHGIGEIQLLAPAMAKLAGQGRWLSWIAPPHLPYAPALAAAGIDLAHLMLVKAPLAKHALWAMEQALRSGTCGMVLGWVEEADARSLRRLQLAAENGQSTGILFRPQHVSQHASPAALRLRLEPATDGLTVHILKRRGGWARQPVLLRRSYAV